MTKKLTHELTTEQRKVYCALDEQLGRSLLARPISRQVVDKHMKPFQSDSLNELIGTGVPE